MYLKTINLKNFRKYKHLTVEFKKGLNVLIGENDSGKTAIVDAIRYILNTKSYEQIRFDEKDFHKSGNEREKSFEIEAIISGLEPKEAGNFLEWAYFNENKEYELRICLKANLQINNRITYDIKAGPEGTENQMDGNARELLKVTYLKPLRDAENELTPGYRSRLAQILLSHKYFEKQKDAEGRLKSHPFEDIIKEANYKIKDLLNPTDQNNNTIIRQINKYLDNFLHENDKRKGKARLEIAHPELYRILRSLSLELEENTSGLGTLNKLFMAAELLHLESDPYNGLRLCLIEELEAHLYPQAQLRIIKALEGINDTKEIKDNQIILTTHSTTLGSSIKLDYLILCKGKDVYPMWKGKTKLEKGDYDFLERFLDATKANLFFARGVILVEGDAENILIPTVAEIIGKPLHKFGVSVVNVGSTAFLRYVKIFMRNDGKKLTIPVAVITDLDVRAMEYYADNNANLPEVYVIENEYISTKDKKYDISALKGNIYTKMSDLKYDVRILLEQESLPTDLEEEIKKIIKRPIDSTLINKLRILKKVKFELNYNHDPVKVFANRKWTLEYDLAFSEKLRVLLAQSILLAKKIKNNDSYDFSSIPDEIKREADELSATGKREDFAYNIYKPLLKNHASKAVTAQIFSHLLKENKIEINKNPNEDDPLKYIIDAITYVCDNQEADNV